MRALTIKNPWASLIVDGVKTIENRTWSTKYRGPLAIHIAKNRAPKSALELVPDDYAEIAQELWATNPDAGCLIGVVMLVDCIRDSDSPWALPDRWHWVLTNPWRCDEPETSTGRLGLWECDWELIG